MDLALIVIDKQPELDESFGYTIFHINENLVQDGDYFAFIPNREFEQKTNNNLCFIPYSRFNGENYSNNARATHYRLGQDNCLVYDALTTYPIHKQVGLLHSEELDISIILTQFLLSHDFKVTLTSRPELKEKESAYLNKLISEDKVKILNE